MKSLIDKELGSYFGCTRKAVIAQFAMHVHPYQHPKYVEQFELVEDRLKLFFDDRSEFLKIVANGLAFSHVNNADTLIQLLQKKAFFSIDLFKGMISGGKSFGLGPISYIWRRLDDRDIFREVSGFSVMPVTHVINEDRLLSYLQANTFQNIFYPPAALVSRYEKSIIAVDIQTKNGDLSRGSAFFVAMDTKALPVLITCKHNVDPADGIILHELSTSSGQKLEFDDIRMHPTADIAIISLKQGFEYGPIFHLRTKTEIFDEVYTLGYPYIPGVDAKVVGHRGEVNGRGEHRLNGGTEVLLISNLVSPGNSGGPLLDRDGFCVGMSTRWLEGQWDEEKVRFSAALPAALLRTW